MSFAGTQCFFFKTTTFQRDFLRDYDSKIVAPFIQGILDGLRATAMDPRHKGGYYLKSCMMYFQELTMKFRKLLPKYYWLSLTKIDYFTTKLQNIILIVSNPLCCFKACDSDIEPFLVRPEMGLLEKAVKFVKPWTEVNEETEISNFLKNKITEILFNDIQGSFCHGLDSISVFRCSSRGLCTRSVGYIGKLA